MRDKAEWKMAGARAGRARRIILTDFVEVERIITGHRALEPGFQEARPPIAECMRPAFVVFAYPRHPRIDGLQNPEVALC